MGVIRAVKPVRLICALAFRPEIERNAVLSSFDEQWGSVDAVSPVFDFSAFTDYYENEMGPNLLKCFVGFIPSIDPGRLPAVKHQAQAVEKKWSTDGKRRVNLDPGYVTGSKLVLASTKDFAHRIFLDDGIYGDLQLQYRHGRFRPEAWTFPDYQSETALKFFLEVRAALVHEERDGEENGL
ncbi:MAG TPA: DUF4416 family protein [bacterium]|nr:DUF4416 family protein [bacterium]